jgi:ubiquinone/menaquinone biosynthesis C-methylase UbiE
MMGFYDKRILPHVINFACGMKPTMQQRDKVVPKARGIVLEVGIGSGLNLSFYDPDHVTKVLGLDPSPEITAIAKKAASRAAVDVEFINLPGEEIPLDDNSVDTVLITYTLCTIPDTEMALRNMARVLKPGGYLFVRTNGQSFPHSADDPTFQFHKYEPAELRNKLSQAGFRVIRLGRLNALLGLAEIPREFRARTTRHSYQGVLSEPSKEPAWSAGIKRAVLGFEGHLVRHGASLPLGRTIVALCQR